MVSGGIDLGGTKIEASVFDDDLQPTDTRRIATPRDSYEELLAVLTDQIDWLVQISGQADLPIGLGVAGIFNRFTRRIATANLPATGQTLHEDLRKMADRPLFFANDGDLFTLSESVRGAGAGFDSVFGIILGTGVGGGQCQDGQLINSNNGTRGEIGHLALPASVMTRHELPLLTCGCGRIGCNETYISGPGLTRIHQHLGGKDLTPPDIVKAADQGNGLARQTLHIWTELMAELIQALQVTFDPDCIVIGGGLSKIPNLGDRITAALPGVLLAGTQAPAVRIAKFGDSSGTRGAAIAARRDFEASV